MRTKLTYSGFYLVSLSILGALWYTSALAQEVLRSEVARKSERHVDVKVEASFGDVLLSKGESNKVVVAEHLRGTKDKQRLRLHYNTHGERGDLNIEIKDFDSYDDEEEASSWFTHKTGRHELGEKEWDLKFSDAVSLSYDIELGAGKGDFDFSGLKVKRLQLSTGASSVKLRCDELNPILCENVVIESGVSKFTAENLTNLNFKSMKFSGGVGAYKLDFSGKLQQSATVDIEVGLGALTVYVPRDTPARIISDESWFSSLDLDDCFEQTRKKSVYETPNFHSADKTLTIKIESGLGSVKVKSR